MSYIDGMVAAVPTANKEKYLAHARESAALFKEAGALKVVETWGADVPTGKLTDFYRAVAAEEGETIVLSYITWESKAARDAGWEKLMKNERMMAMEMPFDGKRMIYGAFEVVLEV